MVVPFISMLWGALSRSTLGLLGALLLGGYTVSKTYDLSKVLIPLYVIYILMNND